MASYTPPIFTAAASRHGIDAVDQPHSLLFRQRPDGELLPHSQIELVHHCHYTKRDEALRDLFAYIEGFYNRHGPLCHPLQNARTSLDLSSNPLVHQISLSAGKQKSGRARKGNVHLRTMLVGAATSAARTKGAYLKDKFHRLKARRGAMRAALAIAHKILVAAYHMLAKGLPYRELGEAYLDQIAQTRTVANLKRRIERLGYNVTLEPKAEPA